MLNLFEIPQAGLFQATYLAEVVAVNDPDSQSRVQVRLLSYDGVATQEGPLWARVAVPVAGASRGAFLLPDVGDEVLVAFVNGDARLPIVVGGLWNGAAPAPERLGGAGDRVDRWTLVGKAGTRIAIVEEGAGQAEISFATPGGVTGVLTDQGGGKVEFRAAGTTITLNAQGLAIQTGGTVSVNATQVQITAGQVAVSAAMTQVSGILQCETMIANTVVATTYTPGAGNVW